MVSTGQLMFMVFMLLGFAALCVMLFFVLRSLDELSRTIRADRERLTALVEALDANVREGLRLQGVVLPEAASTPKADDVLDLGFAAGARVPRGAGSSSGLPELKLGE